MSKYSIPFQQLQAQRTLITSEGDYPLPPVNTTKKDGRVIDTGINRTHPLPEAQRCASVRQSCLN